MIPMALGLGEGGEQMYRQARLSVQTRDGSERWFGLSTDSKAALVALLDQPGRKRGTVDVPVFPPEVRFVVVDVNRIPPILLQTFLTVAEAGQISEAARRLHLSQPTVTGHIRRLEANLETTLFIRSANGVSLTERGAI